MFGLFWITCAIWIKGNVPSGVSIFKFSKDAAKVFRYSYHFIFCSPFLKTVKCSFYRPQQRVSRILSTGGRPGGSCLWVQGGFCLGVYTRQADRQTLPWADIPPRRLLQRTVHILLECILVFLNFLEDVSLYLWSH